MQISLTNLKKIKYKNILIEIFFLGGGLKDENLRNIKKIKKKYIYSIS